MATKENWYQTFFDGLAIEMWDNAVPEAYTGKEIEFILSEANLKDPASILDVPCGTGRHSLSLAQAGHSITAIDISDGNILKLNESKRQYDINAITADILYYQFEDTFDLAICMGNSFSYFPYATMVRFIGKVYGALKEGSKFIINSGAIAESILPALKTKNWLQVKDILFLMENSYEVEESVLKTVMRFIKEDQSEERIAYHYVFTLAEIKRMLSEAGFKSISVYAGVDRSVFTVGSSQAYLICEK